MTTGFHLPPMILNAARTEHFSGCMVSKRELRHKIVPTCRIFGWDQNGNRQLEDKLVNNERRETSFARVEYGRRTQLPRRCPERRTSFVGPARHSNKQSATNGAL